MHPLQHEQRNIPLTGIYQEGNKPQFVLNINLEFLFHQLNSHLSLKQNSSWSQFDYLACVVSLVGEPMYIVTIKHYNSFLISFGDVIYVILTYVIESIALYPIYIALRHLH